MIEQSEIDRLRQLEIEPQRLLIGGEWADAEGQSRFDTHSPVDGKRLTSLAGASANDVDKCVSVARVAFTGGEWAGAAPAQRKRVLLEWARRIEQHQSEIAVLGVRDNGTEISMAYNAEPGGAISSLRYYGEIIDKLYGEVSPSASTHLGMVVREPVGVVGVIVPWNFPLMIGMWKVAAALAAGNSVVLKPPGLASLSWLKVAELAYEAGLPKGVLSVITGMGSVTGAALSRHPDVDVLSFTGSGGVGRGLLKDAADSNLKRVYLELGGKSPHIVFSDCRQIEKSVTAAARGVFRNAGQVCVAGTRLLLQEDIVADYLPRLQEYTESLVVGDPLDLNTEVGAVCGKEQLRQNLTMTRQAVAEGATLDCGGKQIRQESGGTYMEPTILTRVKPEYRIAREEVFGPVLAVLSFTDEADALRIANRIDLGLASGLWTDNLARAHRVSRALQAGVVHVNCYGGAPMTVPLGGVKQSGNGYDKSPHALDKFVNLKTIWMDLS